MARTHMNQSAAYGVVDATMTCDYRLETDPRLDDPSETWTCHRSCHEESDYCLFHLPLDEKEKRDIGDVTIRKRLEEEVKNRGKEDKEFIGARFRSLDLGHFVVKASDNYPIDLSYAVIDGDLRLSHSDIVQPMILDTTEINGAIWAERATFRNYVQLRDIDLDRFVSFENATFEGPVTIHGVSFRGTNDHDAYPLFVARFKGLSASEALSFQNTTFAGRLDFRESRLDTVNIHNTTFDIGFFGRSTIESLTITAPRTMDDHGYLSFVGATLENGVLNQPYILDDGTTTYPDESLYYNLEKATIGDIEFSGDENDTVFPYLNLVEAEFEKFAFTAHEPYFQPDWTIHDYEGPMLAASDIHGDLQWDHEPEHSRLETTYMKAKKAAKAAEHPKASSEFFRHQIKHRKRIYFDQLTDASNHWKNRLKAGVRLGGHQLNGAVSGHFERPWRVIGTSILLTVLCAMLYPMLGGISADSGERIIQYEFDQGLDGIVGPFQESLYFSSITITTLGYGDMYPVGAYARHLAGWEARFGSILIALFIFVLGRRIS